MPTLKERLAAKKQGSSRLSGLKNKIGGGLQQRQSGGGGSLRNKFVKRSNTILEKTYEDRNERSKGSGGGRPIFNQELMAQFDVVDFKSTTGDRFIEILPISYDPSIPYFKELSVHFGVGFANDAFICMNRFEGRKGRCYRCERQAVMWRDQVTYTKDQAKALYPADRAVYLLWERTKELIDGEAPDYTLQLWAAPKSKVHSEIQAKVRNKINHTTLDISDVSEGGDGRTVGFTIVKQGDFPDYKAFDLIEREEAIPMEILEKVDAMITYAEEQGYDNCIDMFYNIHEYEELKEAMETEEEETGATEDKPKKRTLAQRAGAMNEHQEMEPQTSDANEEEAILAELEVIQQEMESKKKNKLLWNKWLRDNDYAAAIELDPDEAISAIIDDMYEKAMADLKGGL